MSDIQRYNVLPPSQEIPVDAPPQTLQPSLPDFGSYSNLDGRAQLFYGAIQKNLSDVQEMFQKQWDWEMKQRQAEIEKQRKREEQKAAARLQRELLENQWQREFDALPDYSRNIYSGGGWAL